MKYSYFIPILKKTTLGQSNLTYNYNNYQVSFKYPSYHHYLRPQNELCPLNLLIIVCPILLLINMKVRIFYDSSTETALTLIINDILIYLDNKAPCYLILLYLSSAFDTIDHDTLSIGLNDIVIHGQVHSWFMYFVSSRTYSVKINSSLFPPYVNIHGFPQGYIIGPHYLYSSY